MSQQLRITTARTVSALPDILYQQVVDNLARTVANPGLLPYLAVAGQGSVQVTDNGNSLLAMNLSPKILGQGTMSMGASRNVTGTWSLGTITSPEKLRSMQGVYLRAIGGKAAGEPAFAWFGLGGKGDVPRAAVYVGRAGDQYVWVLENGIEGLSDLVLAILDVATSEDRSPGHPVSAANPADTREPSAVERRNFQVPPVGPVFTPGIR
jgi:hypothetical protein